MYHKTQERHLFTLCTIGQSRSNDKVVRNQKKIRRCIAAQIRATDSQSRIDRIMFTVTMSMQK